jgi:hypothetical protein
VHYPRAGYSRNSVEARCVERVPMKARDRNKLGICGGQIVKQLINTFMEIKAETLLSSASQKGVLKPVSLKSIHPQTRQLNFITRNSKE